MADRIVNIKLIADATGMVQGLGRARDAAGELNAKVKESAKSQRAEWATVGSGLTAVGVAITGVGAAALATGIQYNTLQQTSRAAMTSLLGSAQAANAQMDKLDDFARNSPFSKATFITAQQQMLAFGIEAKKVIPYLDGVQNAVAAAGGSNADIEGIVATMSKIQSSSKITAQDLMEFGNRGVNAAELIGSQMGKTGAQIREDITAGSLGAEEALDALTAGMSSKFEGAADNVKNTFEGSMDRVKAAWRDFSAELAKPLVDPNGGGALVDLLNWTADAMRNFEKLPEPVKNTVSALTGLVGVGALAGGTFMLALPRILEFNAALAALGITSGVARAGLVGTLRFLTGPWGAALIAAAATVAIFNASMDSSKVSADQMETSIRQGASALEVMRDTAAKNEQGLTKLFVDVGSQVENLGPLLDKAADSGRGFFSAMSFNETAMLDNLKVFGEYLEGLTVDQLPAAQAEFAKFAEESELSGEQLVTALGEMGGFKSALISAAEAAGIATDDTTLLKLATGELKIETAASAAETARQESGLIAMSDAAAAAWKEVNSLVDSLNYFNGVGQTAEQQNAKLQEALADVESHVNNARDGVEGYSLSLDGSTVEGSKNRAMLADLAGQSQATAKAIYEQEVSILGADKATANYKARLEEGRATLIEVAKQFGLNDAEAKAFADTVAAMPTKHDFKLLANTSDAQRSLESFIAEFGTMSGTINYRANLPDLSGPQTSGNGRMGTYAYGGTVGYAAGGTIPGYASGSTVGIGGGVSGGTVYGQGTAKSDSVLVRLSRGEEVIQEPYASLARPYLKAINRGDFMNGVAPAQNTVVVREIGDVYVQNPVTGKYLLAQMDARANAALDAHIDQWGYENRRAR